MLIAIAIAEEIQGLQRIALKFWASEFSLTLARSLSCTGLSWSAPHEPIFSSGSVVASMPKITRSQTWARTPQRFTPAQTSTTFVKVKENSESQNFVILGSLLQWRWQWASLGHFVFLFLTCPTSTKGKTSGWFGAFCVCLITYLHDWAICPKISQTCRNHMFQIVPEKIWPIFQIFWICLRRDHSN